jgi:hypothetical protein
MSREDRERTEQRKALLVSKAELERIQMSLLVHDIREMIVPAQATRARGKRPGMVAATLVGIGVPLIGRQRLTRALRGVSLGLAVWRMYRNWRSNQR